MRAVFMSTFVHAPGCIVSTNSSELSNDDCLFHSWRISSCHGSRWEINVLILMATMRRTCNHRWSWGGCLHGTKASNIQQVDHPPFWGGGGDQDCNWPLPAGGRPICMAIEPQCQWWGPGDKLQDSFSSHLLVETCSTCFAFTAQVERSMVKVAFYFSSIYCKHNFHCTECWLLSCIVSVLVLVPIILLKGGPV